MPVTNAVYRALLSALRCDKSQFPQWIFGRSDMNRATGRSYQATKGASSGIRDMDENVGTARGDQISARLFDRSGQPRWGLLLLAFAGNIVVATVAWLLVGLFIR